MKIKQKLIVTSILAATGASATMFSSAQVLEEVMVTAAKRGAQNLQDVPMAISSYDGETLETFGILNFDQIALKTTGMTFTENSGTVQPFIRGIGSEFPVPGLEPSVSVYLDDVYWQRATGSNYDLVDFDSLQVLKGPQGTLYGRNATGGAIILSTKNPEYEDSGKLLFEAGSEGRERIDAIFNKQISDNTAFRLAARYSDQDGYVDNPFENEDFGGYERYAVRGKLLYTGNDISALLTIGYNENTHRSGLRQSIVDAPLCLACLVTGASSPTDDYETFQGVPELVPDLKDDVLYATLKLDFELEDMTFTSITSLRDASQEAGTDEGMFNGAGPFAINFLTFNVVNNEGEDFLQEFRITSPNAGKFSYLLGVNAQYTDETHHSVIETFLAPGVPGALETDSSVESTSASIYGELYVDLSEALELTLSGRYNYDKKESDTTLGGALTGLPDYGYSDSWTEFTPRVVLAWTPDDDQNYYISYSEGFKSGGFNIPTLSQSTDDVLDPETIWSIEVGAKNSLLNNRLRTTLALFYYEHDDIQVGFVSSSRGSIKENAGESEAFGLELEAQFALTAALQLDFGYSYLDAEYKKYPNASLLEPSAMGGFEPASTDLAGEVLPRAPEHTAYVTAGYNFSLGDNWDGGLTLTGRYTSEYDLNPGRGGSLGFDYQDDVTVVNFTGSFGPVSEKYRIGFYVNNLTDEVYVKNVTTGQLGVYQGVALPRTYGVNLTFNF